MLPLLVAADVAPRPINWLLIAVAAGLVVIGVLIVAIPRILRARRRRRRLAMRKVVDSLKQ